MIDPMEMPLQQPWIDCPGKVPETTLPHNIEREGGFIIDWTDDIVIDVPNPGLI